MIQTYLSLPPVDGLFLRFLRKGGSVRFGVLRLLFTKCTRNSKRYNQGFLSFR